jgi:hypothetical protein
MPPWPGSSGTGTPSPKAAYPAPRSSVVAARRRASAGAVAGRPAAARRSPYGRLDREAQTGGRAGEVAQGLGLGGGQRAQQPDPAVEHQLRGRHAGEQGDLGVPRLDVEAAAHLHGPAAGAVRDDLLLGQLQLDRAAAHGVLPAQRPQLGQRGDRGVHAPGLDVGLHARRSPAAPATPPAPAPARRR